MEKNNNILVETLTRGRNCAKRVQNLLCGNEIDYGSVSINDLAMEMSECFTYGLSLLNASCGSGDPAAEVFVFNGDSESIPPPLVKQKRGRHRKRQNMDLSVKVSDTIEDGYVWRTYGQKMICNFKFPRYYYRCTHKDDYGCMALKQVQQLEDESNNFHIKYFGHHTCPKSPQAHIVSVSDHAVGPRPTPGTVLDFEAFNNHGYHKTNPSNTKSTHISPSKKQKVSSSKVSSDNDGQSPLGVVSNDMLIDGVYPCFESPGSDYGDSSSSDISNRILEMDFSQNDDFFNEILADDVFLILESL